MFERSRQGAVDVVSGTDPLDEAHLEAARAALEPCLAAGRPAIVFNLARVAYIDSAGLELLLDLSDRCRARGGEMQLAGPNGLCGDILRVTEVADRFSVFDNVTSAVGSFAR